MMHDVGDNETHTEDYSEEEYKEATKLKAPVLIASVDCVEQEDLCWDRGIEGYPTLTMFVGGDNELVRHRWKSVALPVLILTNLRFLMSLRGEITLAIALYWISCTH